MYKKYLISEKDFFKKEINFCSKLSPLIAEKFLNSIPKDGYISVNVGWNNSLE